MPLNPTNQPTTTQQASLNSSRAITFLKNNYTKNVNMNIQ